MSKVFDNINVQKVSRGAYEEHVHPEIRSAITEELPLICYKSTKRYKNGKGLLKQRKIKPIP